MDNLDVNDKHYDSKYADMQKRLDRLYEEIDSIEYEISTIQNRIDSIIQQKSEYKTDSKVIIPILANGDPIGSVTILPAAGKSLSDLEFTTARLGAGFLGRQMDN